MERFLQICTSTLDKFETQKKSYIRGNNLPFTNVTTKSAFMSRSLKNRPDNNKRAQRYYCVSLLRKTKKNYYANLNEKDLNNKKKTIWQTIKPLLPDQTKSSG